MTDRAFIAFIIGAIVGIGIAAIAWVVALMPAIARCANG